MHVHMADGGTVEEGRDDALDESRDDERSDDGPEDDGPTEIADHVERVRDLLGDGPPEESGTED